MLLVVVLLLLLLLTVVTQARSEPLPTSAEEAKRLAPAEHEPLRATYLGLPKILEGTDAVIHFEFPGRRFAKFDSQYGAALREIARRMHHNLTRSEFMAASFDPVRNDVPSPIGDYMERSCIGYFPASGEMPKWIIAGNPNR